MAGYFACYIAYNVLSPGTARFVSFLFYLMFSIPWVLKRKLNTHENIKAWCHRANQIKEINRTVRAVTQKNQKVHAIEKGNVNTMVRDSDPFFCENGFRVGKETHLTWYLNPLLRLCDYFVLFCLREKGMKREQERNIDVRKKHGSVTSRRHPEPITGVCAQTRNQTFDSLVHRPMLPPTEPQGLGPALLNILKSHCYSPSELLPSTPVMLFFLTLLLKINQLPPRS